MNIVFKNEEIKNNINYKNIYVYIYYIYIIYIVYILCLGFADLRISFPDVWHRTIMSHNGHKMPG
jgi:hypothetical protein